jgi:hypothetical protein
MGQDHPSVAGVISGSNRATLTAESVLQAQADVVPDRSRRDMQRTCCRLKP